MYGEMIECLQSYNIQHSLNLQKLPYLLINVFSMGWAGNE